METLLISVLFVLVFWGGLVFFVGEAIILMFTKGERLLLKRLSVFQHHEYYNQGFFGKVGRIFFSSDLRLKAELLALVCVYAFLSGLLVFEKEGSVSILEKMLQWFTAL